MGRKYTAPESLDTNSGNYLQVKGTFHCVITKMHDPATNKEGTVLDAFQADFAVLDGTVRDKDGCTETKKTFNIKFWEPKLNGKDEGAFARLKQGRFFLASNLMRFDDSGKDLDIDMNSAVGQQVILHAEYDGKYIDLAYADIWHVDDPDCAAIPKDADALAMIKPENRLERAVFEANKSTTEAAPVAAAAAVDLDDI